MTTPIWSLSPTPPVPVFATVAPTAVAMSNDGNWLVVIKGGGTAGTDNRTYITYKKESGAWVLKQSNLMSGLGSTSVPTMMKFSYDDSKLAVSIGSLAIMSFNASTGVLTLDTITTASTGNNAIHWHPSALAVAVTATAGAVYVITSGTTWDRLGSTFTVTNKQFVMFSGDGNRIIMLSSSSSTAVVYPFNISTGVGTVLATGWSAIPTTAAGGRGFSLMLGGVDTLVIVATQSSNKIRTFQWNGTLYSQISQINQTQTPQDLVPVNGGNTFVSFNSASPYITSFELSSSAVLSLSTSQPDTSAFSTTPTAIGGVSSSNNEYVIVAFPTSNVQMWLFKQAVISVMVGYLPTSAANVTGLNIESGVFVGYLAQAQALVDLVSGIQSTGEMVGLMPTTAAVVATTKAVTAAMIGYLPESAGAVKIVEHVSGDMVGYLPNSSATVEASMHFVAAMSGYLPESAADIMIPIDMSAQMVGLLPTGTGSVLVGSGYGLDSAMVGLLPSSASDVLITIPPYATTAVMTGYLPETTGAVLMTDERTMSAAMEGYLPETTADVFHEPPYDISVDMSGYMPTSSTLLGYVAPAGTDKLADIRANLALKGRKVTFVKRHDVIDAANPMGPTLGTLETISDVPAVFVYPSGLVHLGLSKLKKEMFNECEKICMVTTPETGEDLSTFDYVVDQDINWEIVTSETLQPGFIKLLYYIGMKRS